MTTLSPLLKQATPVVVDHALGSWIHGTDGQSYLDFTIDDEEAWQTDKAWNPAAKARSAAATPPAAKKKLARRSK